MILIIFHPSPVRTFQNKFEVNGMKYLRGVCKSTVRILVLITQNGQKIQNGQLSVWLQSWYQETFLWFSVFTTCLPNFVYVGKSIPKCCSSILPHPSAKSLPYIDFNVMCEQTFLSLEITLRMWFLEKIITISIGSLHTLWLVPNN